MDHHHDEPTAETLDLTQYATHGFCPGYPLKRHRHETLANAGCFEARRDWERYIGPAREFGSCNPLDGNFNALVFPLCRPDRLRLVSYIIEYAYLHDGIVENEGLNPESAARGDAFSLGERETATASIRTGRKQIQAKMMLELNATDKVAAERIADRWKAMLSTTVRERARDFSDLEDYLDFRIVDSAALWVEATMLFGMGITLTKEEDALLGDIARPCYSSLALANDYFSFDREWAEVQSEPGTTPKLVNAVWLYMQWRGVDAAAAKQLVVEAANWYETAFLDRCERFRKDHAPLSPKLDRYLRGLSYQVSGNVVWSLSCPRYHPEYRYDPNAGIEDALTAEQRVMVLRALADGQGDATTRGLDRERPLSVSSAASQESSDSGAHTTYSWDSASISRASSVSGPTAAGEGDGKPGGKGKPDIHLPARDLLGAEHLKAPFLYMESLPSKGVRNKLADALNMWADLPEDMVEHIKGVVGELHTASLMLDDIEDGSDLRRGYPAAHGVFGAAQTINAASFAIVEALRKTHDLSKAIPGASEIAFEQLRDLHIGQSHDLHWTRHAACPTEEQYLDMVSKKTGGLFRLLSRLMCSHLEPEVSSAIDDMVQRLGVYFQIRDDYENLSSDEYTSQKGFCEDLDEGKFSFPLVHHLSTAPPAQALQVSEVLEQRRETGGHRLSEAQKRLVLQSLQDSGSIDYTRDALRSLQARIEESIAGLERRTGRENWVLRLCMQMLSV